jgi:hypothetical protein
MAAIAERLKIRLIESTAACTNRCDVIRHLAESDAIVCSTLTAEWLALTMLSAGERPCARFVEALIVVATR